MRVFLIVFLVLLVPVLSWGQQSCIDVQKRMNELRIFPSVGTDYPKIMNILNNMPPPSKTCNNGDDQIRCWECLRANGKIGYSYLRTEGMSHLSVYQPIGNGCPCAKEY